MPLYIKDAGSWKNIKKIFVKDANLWRTVSKGWIKNNGIWRQFYSAVVNLTIAGGTNVNLRSNYNEQTGDSSNNSVSVIFTVTGNIGSSGSSASIVTGNWPAGSELTLNINSGVYIAGAAGSNNGGAGGTAISLNYPLTINNLGIIAGGGGGGGNSGGGAGAGWRSGSLFTSGAAGAATTISCIKASPWQWNQYYTSNGTGGSLGSNGTSGRSYQRNWGTSGCDSGASNVFIYDITYPGGIGGVSIARNGFALTGSTGDTRGTIT